MPTILPAWGKPGNDRHGPPLAGASAASANSAAAGTLAR